MKLSCNLCGASKNVFLLTSCNLHGRTILNKDKFKLYRCSLCRNIFLAGIKTDKNYYQKYYESDYHLVNVKKSIFHYLLNFFGLFSMRRKVGYIFRNINRAKINILDIGCATGSFLEKLDQGRFIKFGVEIDKKAAQVSASKKITVYNSDFLQTEFKKQKFNVITMWQVFEHIPKPRELLRKIREILTNDGALIFTAPNSNSLGFRLGKKYWYHLDSPRHLFIPNKDNVSRLLKQSGFKIIGIVNEFYDYPLDLFWSVRKSLWRFLIYPLYPVFKIPDSECLTFICKRVNDTS